MTKGYLYHSLVNRKNKYRLKSRLEEAMQIPSNYVECDVGGCYVSQTSSYVDIRLPNRLPSSLFEYSCIRFTNTDYTDYIAFIDRIEPNNFNTTEDNLYYRLYITIDWWSTLQLSSQAHIEDICSHLEGNVERAHLDNVKEDGGRFIMSLDNTLPVQEEVIDYHIKKTDKLATTNLYTFAYLLVNPIKTGYAGVDSYAQFGLIKASLPFIVGCVPIKDGVIQKTQIYRRQGAVEAQWDYLGGYGRRLNDLVDDELVSYFITSITPRGMTLTVIDGEPVWRIGTENIDSGDVILIRARDEVQENFYIEAMVLDNSSYSYDMDEYATTISDEIGKPLFIGKKEISIPLSYEEYLRNEPKSCSQVYINIGVACNDDTYYLDYSYAIDSEVTNGVNLQYQLSMETGGLILFLPTSINKTISSATVRIGKNALSKPVVSVNDFALFSGLLSTAQSVMGIASKGAQISNNWLSKSNAFMATMNATNFFVEGAKGIATYVEQKQGDVAGIPTCEMQSYDIGNPRIICEYPHNLNVISKHLALYGYNTYLHPHEVLSGHRRKYFNYIKTNNALVNVSGFSQEIKMHIEEMFNNGVWLWNNVEEFGNYEVPNYPIIMEEQ